MLNVGDLVKFKHGGPLMTVVSATKASAKCMYWVPSEAQHMELSVPHNAVDVVKPREAEPAPKSKRKPNGLA